MKLLFIILLFAAACSRQSSPEGRSIIRDEQIQQQINFLKQQNSELLDSIRLIKNDLQILKHKKGL